MAQVYVESTISASASATAAKPEQIPYSNPEQLLADLQQQDLPKEVLDQLKQKMKLGPLKGKYSFRIQTARDRFTVIDLEF